MIERRQQKSQIRLVDVGQASSPGTAIGYAATFGRLSEDLGGFREKVASGFVTRCLAKNPDVWALVNHSKDMPIGRTKNKSLQLSTDARGLQMRCTLPNTSLGRDTAELLRNGTMSEMSFAFTVDEGDGDDWTEEDSCECGDPNCDDDNCRSIRIPVRTLKNVSLKDVSILSTSPAYSGTSVGLNEMPSGVWGRNLPGSMPMELRSRVESRISTAERRKALANLIMGL